MTGDPAELARLLADAEHAVVLTGAGVSTESGIPDFRSAGGLWERYDPFEVASMSTFLSDPSRFWEFHRPRIEMKLHSYSQSIVMPENALYLKTG